MQPRFSDRTEAGSLLATQLRLLPGKNFENSLILALPRGGVPVAIEISRELDIPFDVLIVRKIGHPRQKEYGVGAVTEDGFSWIDPDAMGLSEISVDELQAITEIEIREVGRRVVEYRQGRPLSSFEGKSVIIVDDGLATGVTAQVAVRFARARGASRVTLAVPVCSDRTAERLRAEVDEFVCLIESAFFFAVGEFYEDFEQVSDAEVKALIASQSRTK